jgi:hypothetical protein
MELTITDDQWDSTYQPLPNTVSGYNEYDQLFETYGADLDFVRKHSRDRIWTQVDGDDDKIYILNGYHIVNRIGYYITKKPHNVSDLITVRIGD